MRYPRSISLPIVLASITVCLTIAMLVGWILVLLQNRLFTQQVAQNTWLMVAGIVSLAMIAAVLVILSVFVVREILAARRQDSFIDSVTHELKSPLASLKLCVETLARPALNAEQQQAVRSMMGDDVERLTVFIDDILEASRTPLVRRAHTLSDVDLPALLQRCAQVVNNRYKMDAVQLDVPSTLHLRSDRTALETIFKNLADNAVKYSDPPVRVKITARVHKNILQASVEDHGIGVSPRQLKRIFERFYRVPEEAVRTRNGTGLGLFVVQALVKSLDGKIWAESAGLGHGLCVRLQLPLRPSS